MASFKHIYILIYAYIYYVSTYRIVLTYYLPKCPYDRNSLYWHFVGYNVPIIIIFDNYAHLGSAFRQDDVTCTFNSILLPHHTWVLRCHIAISSYAEIWYSDSDQIQTGVYSTQNYTWHFNIMFSLQNKTNILNKYEPDKTKKACWEISSKS